MSRIGSMMSVGKQALANSQTALQTTSHNIANSATEGYTRQRVENQAMEPVTSGRVRIGQGAKTTAVTRIVNGHLSKQIQEETSKLGTSAGREAPLMRVEQVYNESINKGLNRFLANFFNAFREFGNNPESQATRALVKENSKILVDDFHRVHGQMKDIQKDVDAQIKSQVSEINGYVKEIASLNEKIQQVEIQGMPSNDERDRRELVLKKIGELVNIRWAEGDNGMVTVTAGNTALLVSGYEHNELLTKSTPAREGKKEGNVEIFFRTGGAKGSEFNVTKELKGGQIGGALDVRDNVINDLHAQMDHIAFTVAEAVNEIHNSGYDRYDNTGRDFFNPLEEEFDASIKIQVDEDILRDPALIASAQQPGAPGDNRIANRIANLQQQSLFKQGTTTLDDYFNGIVGEFAVLTRKNNMVYEHQKNIVGQLNNVRESISGVSLDEETADMVKFQKAFDASARLIKVADEMLETVLNLKRL